MKPFPHRGAGAPARFITGEEQSEAQAVQPASVHSNGLNPGSSPGGATISPTRAFGTAFLLGRGVCDAEGQHRASVLDGHAEPKSGGRGGDTFDPEPPSATLVDRLLLRGSASDFTLNAVQEETRGWFWRKKRVGWLAYVSTTWGGFGWGRGETPYKAVHAAIHDTYE